MLKIRKNDIVEVIAGEDKGKTGKILKVFPKRRRVIVEGVNFVKRHTRPRRAGQPGGILEKEAPIDISNVMLVCPKCAQRTRVGIEFLADGRKVRYCRKCGEMIEG